MPEKPSSLAISLGIIAIAVGLAYVPIQGQNQSLIVVSGSELQEPLSVLERHFEETHPSIDIDLKFQGSRDIINRYVDNQNDFTPTILIPANSTLLDELEARWQTQENSSPFYGNPQPIAKTILVGVAWQERGNALFPTGVFDWTTVESALTKSQWSDIGGDAAWGSFDLLITDPTRSNSGQLALSLWGQEKTGNAILSTQALNTPDIPLLFNLVKRSVYQPPSSTDTLLQEFISRGPNDADIALVYESIALSRWQQSQQSQGEAYQIYYVTPTIETVSTAAIATRNVNKSTSEAAQTFIDFLTAPDQQATFVEYGFRTIDNDIDLSSIPKSPWAQSIPGASIAAPRISPAPDQETLSEIVRLWQRAQ